MPGTSSKVSHEEEEVDPSTLTFRAPHSMQLSADVNPVLGLNRPVGQFVQGVEDEVLYLPSGQTKHVVRLGAGSWPAGHIAASRMKTDVSVTSPSQPIDQMFVPEGGLSVEESTSPLK